MFKYQIHKLSKGGKEVRTVLLEDILTSDVFGVMAYFPYERLLRPFLEEVAAKNQEAKFIVPGVEPIKFSFWESIAWHKGLPQLDRVAIEPDVLIEWEDLVFIVEAKFISPTDPEELLREFLVASRRAISGKKFFLLLIDKNLSSPSVLYGAGPERVRISEYIEKRLVDLNLSEQFAPELVASSILWINWQSFYALTEKMLQKNRFDEDTEIDELEKRILNDLLLILERKGFVPFEVLEFEDFEKYFVDLDSLGEVGLRMRESYSDLSDISIDLSALGKIGLKVNDPIPFLSGFELDADFLTDFLKHADNQTRS